MHQLNEHTLFIGDQQMTGRGVVVYYFTPCFIMKNKKKTSPSINKDTIIQHEGIQLEFTINKKIEPWASLHCILGILLPNHAGILPTPLTPDVEN